MKVKIYYLLFIYLFICSCSHTEESKSKVVFYLHGKILEDQGIRAHSHKYGPYLYQAILDSLNVNGFKVISELRPKNTEVSAYAAKVVKEIDSLLLEGYQPTDISVIGASKGGFIALEVSHLIQLPEINYVILAACNKANMPKFSGRVLSIYDKSDGFARDCRYLSKAQGYTMFKEIITKTDLGHGLLYKPHSEWLVPTLEWLNDSELH